MGQRRNMKISKSEVQEAGRFGHRSLQGNCARESLQREGG